MWTPWGPTRRMGLDYSYESYDDNPLDWFGLMDCVVPMFRRTAPIVVMPVCQINRLAWWYERHKPDWLIAWYKGSPGTRSPIGFNDWEPHVVFGRPKRNMHDYFATRCGFQHDSHPCPKPIEYALWLVARVVELGDVVCDPFMGSGTTGVACVRLGRKFFGIEIEPKYFDIACRRIEEEYRRGDFLRPTPTRPTKRREFF